MKFAGLKLGFNKMEKQKKSIQRLKANLGFALVI
jgi:hypothetical protein